MRYSPRPNIFQFKAFGMINLHCEVRIGQKIYNRVTMTIYVKCVVRFNVHKTLHVPGQWKSKNSCSWAGMSYSAVAPRRHGGGLSYANVCTRGWPQRWCFSPVCVEVEQMLWLKHSKAWWLVWPQFLSLKELMGCRFLATDKSIWWLYFVGMTLDEFGLSLKN